jgi:hypothetical protein
LVVEVMAMTRIMMEKVVTAAAIIATMEGHTTMMTEEHRE